MTNTQPAPRLLPSDIDGLEDAANSMTIKRGSDEAVLLLCAEVRACWDDRDTTMLTLDVVMERERAVGFRDAMTRIADPQIERLKAERDAARADAAVYLDAFVREVSSLHRWHKHEAKLGECAESELCQRHNAIIATRNPGAPLLALRDAAVAWDRVVCGGEDVAEVVALRAAIADLEAK